MSDLTVADLVRLADDVRAMPKGRVTVSAETVDVLRASDVRSAVSSLYGMPLLARDDGNYRLVHPEDRAHLAEHDGGRPGCERCWAIWND